MSNWKTIFISWLTCLAFLSLSAHARTHRKRACRPSTPPSSSTSTTTQPSQQGGGIIPIGSGSLNGNVSNSNPSSSGNGAIKFPSGCLVSSSGYGIGVDYDTDPADLVSGLGANPCVYGRFYELADWSGLATEAASMAKLANGVKSILMLSLKTSNTYSYPDNAISSVVSVLNGLDVPELWLRFGHEMTMDGPEGNYPHDPAAYVALWKKVSTQVNRNKVKMYWCMNPPSKPGQSWDNLASWASPWHPGPEHVDINGIDTYANDASTTLQERMAPAFCSLFGNKPIFNGEVGVFGAGAGPDVKKGWATKLLDPSIKTWCPSYVGFAWFEIKKEGVDYTAAANGILKSVAGGSGSGAAGGGTAQNVGTS